MTQLGRPFRAGETVLFVDSKDRRNLITLTAGGEYHTHTGFVPHDEVIGVPEVAQVKSTGGANYLVVRPTLAEYVLKMKRGAQVIYPKDLGPLLLLADIFPGANVLEAGVGSGALSMTMLRAGANVLGYEIREDFAERAIENVRAFLDAEIADRYRVEIRDIYEGIDATDLDRIVLDLPEPWRVAKHAASALRAGGIFVSYLPSIMQVQQLHEALDENGFEMADTLEIMQRGWHVAGRAVRPDHRMVGHTGFLTHARLLGTADR
jgi:tRNA (adenine57-N1/adenine58-N1)-methyltransferase catalytic subunit